MSKCGNLFLSQKGRRISLVVFILNPLQMFPFLAENISVGQHDRPTLSGATRDSRYVIALNSALDVLP